MVRTSLAIATLVLGQAIAWPFVAEYLAVDRCLAAGGNFDYDGARCDFGYPHPGIAIWQRHGVALVLSCLFGVAGCVLLVGGRKRG